MSRARFATLVFSGLLFAAAPVFAGSVTIDFSSPTTLIGNTATYTAAGKTITAVGWQCTDSALSSGCNTSVSLFAKTGGLGETGLGISNGGDEEIQDNQFIQFDFSQLAGLGISHMTFEIGSVQTNEGFRIFDSSTAGSAGSLLTSVTGNGSNNINGIIDQTVSVNLSSDAFISFSAIPGVGTNSDVLVDNESFSATPTPEPGTLLLMGSGLLLVGFGVRRFS